VNDTIVTDVLIIGSDGAGSRAAIAADDVGVDVTIVSKGLFTKDGTTTMATGAINIGIGHTDSRDTPMEHFIDTIEGGDHLNDQPLVKLLCKEILPRLIDVETFGMLCARTDEGKFLLSRVGGHTYPAQRC
jgi:fumarate reductase (CoM/CoB) subunit A